MVCSGSNWLQIEIGEDITIYQIRNITFSIKVEFETQEIGRKCGQFLSILATKRGSKLSNVTSCYLERVIRVTTRYWEGTSMISIRHINEKMGERDRTETSYNVFRKFIKMMDMEEVSFQ